MKKDLILTAVFFLLCNCLFSQTWTARSDEHWDIEWKMTTREEWNRLLKQKEAQYTYATLEFTDVLEIEHLRVTTIKGTRPQLSGYFYLLGNMQPRTREARDLQNRTGYTTILSYGNGRTGDFDISFFNNTSGFLVDGLYSIGSDSYTRRYNQCLRWVNGE